MTTRSPPEPAASPTKQAQQNHSPNCPLCRHVLNRVPRSPLMRLLPGSMHYYCQHCHTRFFSFLGRLFQI